jgi:predicted aldo/keto reductase-like oxidoreductase
MSNFEQLRENICTFERESRLNERELEAMLGIADGLVKSNALPCTACKYCVSHCPQQLDIPKLIELYNEHCFTGNSGLPAFIAPMALAATAEDKRPGACIGCKNCEAVCPQQIKISEAMSDFAGKLG